MTFAPDHCSTQKNLGTKLVDSSANKKAGNPSGAESTTDVTGTAASTSVDQSVTHTVGRSIPFEPYTLPSLKTEMLDEDDALTQPFTSSVKQEPASQTVDQSLRDVTDCIQGKRRAEQMDIGNGDNLSHWLGGKKQRLDTTNNNAVKTDHTGTGGGTTTNAHRLKQEQQDEDLFDLPKSTSRSRRRAALQASIYLFCFQKNLMKHQILYLYEVKFLNNNNEWQFF